MEGFQSLKGKLLIASPSIQDIIFGESVILVLDHTPQSAFGLILNKALGGGIYRLPKVLQSVPSLPESFINDIYYGGPVDSKTMFVLHSNSDLIDQSDEILPNVFLGITEEILSDIFHAEQPFRLFFGHSIWSEEQLEDEVYNNIWIVADAEFELIFNHPIKSLWREVLNRQGGIYSYFAKNVKNPKLN